MSTGRSALAKCPYCDFNSHVHRGAFDEAAYVEAYKQEIGYFARLTQGPHGAVDLFRRRHALADGPALGGAILETIGQYWNIAPKAEITLEANPTSVEADRFRGYRAAGVNRVSLGRAVAARGPLAELGRRHTVDEAIAAVRLAQSIFPRSSFDLIYARPQPDVSDWEDELKEALWLSQGHVSLYQLTIEMGTRYFDLCNAGKLKMPDEDLSADFYELTQELTRDAGLPAYEISNHARPGQESRPQPHLLALRRICRHRARRAWAPPDRRPAPRHRDRKAALRVAEARRHARPRHGDRRHPHLGRGGRRAAGDGAAAPRRHRSGATSQALAAARSTRRQIDELKTIGFVETLPNGNLRVTDKGWPVLDAVVADLAA